VSAPRATDVSATTAGTTGGRRLGRALRAAVRAERDVWLSIGRLLLRRPRVPSGASAFRYDAPVRTILVIFLVLSAVEVVILDLIVHPWPWVRIPLLVLGLWGVLWMAGLLAAHLTRPHAVGPEGIRARSATAVDADLRWEDVAAVSRSRDVEEKAPKVREEANGPTLALRMQNETNLLVELERAVPVRLGDDVVRVRAVRLWADDPDAFLAAVRAHIP
jgi:hypothetical protein